MLKSQIRIQYLFARVKKIANYQEMDKIQLRNFQHYTQRYIPACMLQHQDIFMQEQIYGKLCFVTGHTPNNIQSTEFARECFKYIKPKVLGGLSDCSIESKPGKISKSNKGVLYEPEKMYCKSQILQYLQLQKQTNPNFFYQTQKKHILILDHQNKRICTNDYFCAAYETMFDQSCKLSYGKPSDTIIFEDLLLNLSLQDLKQMFYKNCQKILQNEPFTCDYHPGVIIDKLRYQALKDQPKLYSKEVLFVSALLKKIVKGQNRTWLMVPLPFTKKIAEMVHQVNISPSSIYRSFLDDSNSQNFATLKKILSQNKVDEILQKFAILNILKEGQLEHQLYEKSDILSKSYLKDLFVNLDVSGLIYRYNNLKKPYRSHLWQIQSRMIQNIDKFQIPDIKRLTLKKQLQVLEQRKQQFPYTYTAQNITTLQNDKELLDTLHKKMKQLLILEGKQNQLKILNSHLCGNYTKQSIILYSKLLGRANVTLPKKLKLPVFHFGSFRGIYKQYYKNYLLSQNNSSELIKKLETATSQAQKKYSQKTRIIDDPVQINQFLKGKKGKLIKRFNVSEQGFAQQFNEALNGQQVLKDFQKDSQPMQSNQNIIQEQVPLKREKRRRGRK